MPRILVFVFLFYGLYVNGAEYDCMCGRKVAYSMNGKVGNIKGNVCFCEFDSREFSESIGVLECGIKAKQYLCSWDAELIHRLEYGQCKDFYSNCFRRWRNMNARLYMAIKTNLLYDVLLVPNIGVEFYLGRGWSVEGGWTYAWWKHDPQHRYIRLYGGEFGVRRYFGPLSMKKPLVGHHVGVCVQALTYDIELGGRGQLSKWSYGGAVVYGYAMPLARRMNLDFSVGLGYLGGTYEVYDPEEDCYVWKETRKRRWLGPMKAEISLVWLIGRGNYNYTRFF